MISVKDRSASPDVPPRVAQSVSPALATGRVAPRADRAKKCWWEQTTKGSIGRHVVTERERFCVVQATTGRSRSITDEFVCRGSYPYPCGVGRQKKARGNNARMRHEVRVCLSRSGLTAVMARPGFAEFGTANQLLLETTLTEFDCNIQVR
jgi:hypothetical protein